MIMLLLSNSMHNYWLLQHLLSSQQISLLKYKRSVLFYFSMIFYFSLKFYFRLLLLFNHYKHSRIFYISNKLLYLDDAVILFNILNEIFFFLFIRLIIFIIIQSINTLIHGIIFHAIIFTYSSNYIYVLLN